MSDDTNKKNREDERFRMDLMSTFHEGRFKTKPSDDFVHWEDKADLVSSDLLPVHFPGRENSNEDAFWSAFIAAGGERLEVLSYDDLFQEVRFPPSWTKVVRNYAVFALLDESGRERAQVFYKAESYDRKATIRPTTRLYFQDIFDNLDDATRWEMRSEMARGLTSKIAVEFSQHCLMSREPGGDKPIWIAEPFSRMTMGERPLLYTYLDDKEREASEWLAANHNGLEVSDFTGCWEAPPFEMLEMPDLRASFTAISRSARERYAQSTGAF